jgi:hypothetical protein
MSRPSRSSSRSPRPSLPSKSYSSSRSTPIPTPIPTPYIPSTIASQPQTLNVKHETPSLFSSIKSGFGFAIGNRIASNIMGPSVHNQSNPFASDSYSKSVTKGDDNCKDIEKIYNNAIEIGKVTDDIENLYNKCLGRN